jgi:hypothetical protein
MENKEKEKVRIFRYKLSDEITHEIDRFSKIHKQDDRKTFKEAWNLWTEENEALLSMEVRRLTESQYEGDVVQKIFTSARYYYRKKGTEKKTPKERTTYTKIARDVLQEMDSHIEEGLKSPHFKPSDGFADYKDKTTMSMTKEEERKMKKTYKNRYFMMLKSNQ